MSNPAARRRVVIIGGGVMGSATAHFLAAMAASEHDIVVIERDPTYARASSALSASGMRQQFSTPANIDLAAYGAAFLRRAPRELALDGEGFDVDFREKGYLLLRPRRISGDAREPLRASRPRRLQCPVGPARA
jgi:glycine/D-amino acid oxidase-like deaminating enzyme